MPMRKPSTRAPPPLPAPPPPTPAQPAARSLFLPPPVQAHEYLLMVIDTISKAEVDALAKSLLSYLSHYKQEQQVGSGEGGG
jgi:hypothetical protein